MRNLNTDAGAGVVDVSAGAIIQGRDIKQVYIGKKTGAMSAYVGYQKDPFRSFTDFDGNPDEFRQGANIIVDRLFQSAEKHGGLDLTNTYYGQLSSTTAASRITADTPGYSDYFKTVTDKGSSGVSQVNIPPKDTDAIADGNPKNMSQKLIELKKKNKKPLTMLGVTAGSVMADVGGRILGAAEIKPTMEKIEKMGGSKPLQLLGGASEVVGPVPAGAVLDATQAAEDVIVESAIKAEDKTKETASDLISKGLTGGLPLPQLNLNFNRGGFINKREGHNA